MDDGAIVHRPSSIVRQTSNELSRVCTRANTVVVKLMLHKCSPLQRALLQSAVALAPCGLRVANVQYVFDHYTSRAAYCYNPSMAIWASARSRQGERGARSAALVSASRAADLSPSAANARPR